MMIAVCCICDNKLEVPEGVTAVVCEWCLIHLLVNEDGSTDVM
jgi:hypothetical protein